MRGFTLFLASDHVRGVLLIRLCIFIIAFVANSSNWPFYMQLQNSAVSDEAQDFGVFLAAFIVVFFSFSQDYFLGMTIFL